MKDSMTPKERLDKLRLVRSWYLEGDVSEQEACKRVGVSFPWYRLWWKRYVAARDVALSDKPRTKGSYVVKNSPALIKEIVCMERQLDSVNDKVANIQKYVRQIKKRMSDGTV